jgi:hypothetical protein
MQFIFAGTYQGTRSLRLADLYLPNIKISVATLGFFIE